MVHSAGFFFGWQFEIAVLHRVTQHITSTARNSRYFLMNELLAMLPTACVLMVFPETVIGNVETAAVGIVVFVELNPTTTPEVVADATPVLF